MKSKEDAWWAAHNKLLPSRKLLALYYENFRIDAPAINTMAMADLAAVNYLSFGDKNLEGFWEEWKKVSMSVSHCVTSSALNEMLMDKLTSSKILADDVRDLKKTPSDLIVVEDIARMVTNKIEERAVIERTKIQWGDHAKQLLDQLSDNKPKDGKKAAANTATEGGGTPAKA